MSEVYWSLEKFEHSGGTLGDDFVHLSYKNPILARYFLPLSWLQILEEAKTEDMFV